MQKWKPLLAVSLGTLMLLIDITIVIVALPDIQRNLNAGFDALQWVLDAYALALAALVIGAGTLADRFGHQRVYLVGTVLFAAASLFAGCAPSIEVLIAARAVQGVAAAAMFATTVSLLHITYSGRDRGTAFAVWGAVAGASAGLGMVAGGMLTQWLSWRWIFFVNIPVSVVTVALSLTAFVNTRRDGVRLDVAGVVSACGAAAALTFAIIRGGESGWTDAITLVSFAASAVFLVLFLVAETVVAQPMLPLSLFKIRPFTGSVVGATGQSFAAFGVTPLISIWAQNILGLDALQTGLAMLPMAAVSFVVAGSMGKHLDRLHPALTIGASLVGVGVGALLLLLIGPGSGWTAILPAMLVIGVGVGVASPPLAAVALASVRPEQAGVASGTVNMGREFGYALGIAVLGSVFATTAGSSHPREVGDHLRGLDAAWITAGTVGVIVGLVTIAILWTGHAPADPDDTVDRAEEGAVATVST